MKLGIAQKVVAVTIIVLTMLIQLVPNLDAGRGNRRPGSDVPMLGAYSRALAQDDNEDSDNDEDNDDEDNDDDDEDNNGNDDNDEDNEDDDNDGGDDNEDDDNEDDDNDDGDDNEDDDNSDDADNDDDALDEDRVIDNVDADTFNEMVAANDGASFTFDASVREAAGTTTGRDDRIGLPADRILVQSFPWMPSGVSLTVRLTDQAAATTSCRLVGDLVFQIEGRDGAGTALSQLPAEVNLSARYTDQQASGLSKQSATLLWLDPADSQWKPAPKVVTDPGTNYVSASVTALGTYAVCAS